MDDINCMVIEIDQGVNNISFLGSHEISFSDF